MSENSTILLETKDLSKYFTAKKGLLNLQPSVVKAVDHVSLSVKRGETLGLVGESGCGKSTLGRTILRLIPATEGQVLYNGEDILTYDKKKMWEMRRKLQIIFQDPYSSLNPRMTVYDLISAPLEVYRIGTKEERREMVEEILQEVGLDKQYLNRFPHEFSGGQRQRIGIARALILNPEFVVCDEAVSALDVSVRAQVLNLMRNMQQKKNLTYLFISHDLSVVRHISDRIAVMYLGSVAEIAEKAQLYSNPMHPYTKALLSAIPLPEVKKKRQRIILEGDVPSAYNPPSGCKFHTRCPYATDRCKEEIPVLQEVEKGHKVACHRALEIL
ncbi:dipeptide ABC transporter ATP-binding protein [Blautia glucerasea]|uniref:ABC transporter ATP-binding protein n=1 Tax=Blautia glucerasea TaxID=536633 RepID=UPI001D024D3B|nr:dipeptide ABC transporter ATP-binding protein [Blautia glucerasea]MCB5388130.1 dipeptide ABC transporter ATP-binding protein [Blautia glucerasea]MCB5422470.1 dipeptide ABC transporter ATP-binding protein [Blautia luti]